MSRFERRIHKLEAEKRFINVQISCYNSQRAQLMAIFEGLARQSTDLSDLQRTMRYDRLGVNDVLQQIEQDYNNKQFPEPERLLPALDQLAADDKFIDIARQRARTLAGKIRSRAN